MNNLEIKITNHLTGEITEKKIEGADAAEQLYFELLASEKAIKSAKDRIISYLDEWLGGDEEQRFGDGHVIKRQQRETRTWTITGLRSVGLDNDAIEVASKVNMTLAKQIIKESIERGDIKPDAIKDLEMSADVTVTKPFVVLK